MNDYGVLQEMRATLARLDLHELSMEDHISILSKAFSAHYTKTMGKTGSWYTPIIDTPPGETLDVMLKSITFDL